jgi:hypothetical protein
MVPLVPTAYPADPTTGTIIVQNYITIIDKEAFSELKSQIAELCGHLRHSNQFAGETRDKLISEITAGMELLNSPKPDPQTIQLYLVRTLKYIGDKGSGAVIGALAVAALGLLGRATGLW